MIPFVDLKAQYLSIKKEVDAAIAQVMEVGVFISGKHTLLFERQFANYIGTTHCVSCANGTDSMEILLQAYGIGAGDEVIVPAHTWVSTAEVVVSVGAKPVFVDTFADFYTIDTTQIEAQITPKTKAIIPVHLCGLAAEMDRIMTLAQKHQLIVIEDCAQAHGAVYKGKKVGSIGHAASFSFYPTKNLGAYGDGGAIMTNNNEIAEKCRIIANHGQIAKNQHVRAGRNSRLDELQAAVLSLKLKYLNQWNDARAQHAKMYDDLLDRDKISIPKVPKHSKHVYHLYMIKAKNRDDLRQRLEENGVLAAAHYPNILPAMPAFFEANWELGYPVSSANCTQILSLPIYAELTEEQVKLICGVVNKYA